MNEILGKIIPVIVLLLDCHHTIPSHEIQVHASVELCGKKIVQKKCRISHFKKSFQSKLVCKF